MGRPRTSLERGGSSRASRALVDVCRAGLDSVGLRRELRGRLERLVAFDAYCVSTADPDTLLVTSSIGDGLSIPAARRLYAIEEQGDDFNRLVDLARRERPVATIDAATEHRASRSLRMRELFLPLGLGDELRAALTVDGDCWGYLHLFRASHHRPFGADDVLRVEAAAGEIAAALRGASLDESAGAPGDVGVVLLDRDGAITAAGDEARAWLARLADDVGHGEPHALQAVGWRARRASVPARGRSSAFARYKTPRGAWMVLRGSKVGDAAAMVLAPAHATEVAPLLFLAHGLTERERAVATRVCRGMSNGAIAAELGIATYTVKDHVKAIFAKTRTGSRGAFAARFAAATGH